MNETDLAIQLGNALATIATYFLSLPLPVASAVLALGGAIGGLVGAKYERKRARKAAKAVQSETVQD